MRNLGKPVLISLDEVGLPTSQGLIRFLLHPGRCQATQVGQFLSVLSVPKHWGILTRGAPSAPSLPLPGSRCTRLRRHTPRAVDSPILNSEQMSDDKSWDIFKKDDISDKARF